jgi:hypothetical protein
MNIDAPATPVAQRIRTRSIARTEEAQQEQQQQQQHTASPAAPGEIPTNSQGRGAWQSSIVMGSPLWLEGEDPSPIEVADRKVMQLRFLVEHYPGHAEMARLLQEAIQEREQLDETNPVNTQPRYRPLVPLS